jgi:hypothetical protein
VPMISTCPKCDRPVSVPAGVDSSAAVRCPLCNAEYALGEALTPPPPELIPLGLSAAQPSTAIADDVAAETTQPPEGLQHDSDVENEAAAVAEAFPAKPGAPRKRRKPKSALQTLIEVVAGGLAGCLVAYYGLAFYYGPEFGAKGLPILPLPGIEQITAPRPIPDGAKGKPSEKKQKPSKSKPEAADHKESVTRSPCSPGQNVIQFG